jgi:hypothetical protein
MRNSSFLKIFGLFIAGAVLESPGYSQATGQIITNPDAGESIDARKDQPSSAAQTQAPNKILIMTLPTRAGVVSASVATGPKDKVAPAPFSRPDVQSR